jgi:hypothetical protein
MVGDDVYFPVIESVNCPLVIYNEEYYLLMNYEVLYLAKRPCVHMDSANYIKVGDNEFEVTMLNGYLLCKTEEYDDTTPFRIEDRKVKDFKRVRIIFSGIPVEYRSNPLNSPPSNRRAGTCIGYTLPKGYPSNPEIKNGDIVLPMKSIRSSEVMLEDELHLNFDGKNMYRLLQRKYIDAIYEKNN